MAELSSIKELSDKEIELYQNDPTLAGQICPGGTILSVDSAKDLLRLGQPGRSMPELDEIKIHKRENS